MDKESIFVRVRFDVREERHEEFEKLVVALRQQADDEPGTRSYRWFSAEDGSYLVIEEYADSAAAMAHMERAAALLERLTECAAVGAVELHGPIGSELREWVGSNPQPTTFTDFPGRQSTED
ncbi:antibiotic biosynthesis monooxygenase [Streptomyces sp. NBC_00487]|uniref:putative quinol monooxygenase n=1 Tax=unclassified Streptomyces TaxID=2593676 RepID=UPI002E177548|nr:MULTISPECIES: antibiotic biosynthesis monooxygenase family protein [unclassified Streptomyces]